MCRGMLTPGLMGSIYKFIIPKNITYSARQQYKSHLLEYLTGYLYPKILATKSPVEGCLSVHMVTYVQEQLPPSI